MNAPGFFLVVSSLTVRVGGLAVLEGVDMSVAAGESVAVVGPNGAGKTTLVKAILGDIPFAGRVDFPAGRPRIGYVPQRLAFDHALPMTALELLASETARWPLWLGIRTRTRRRAMDLLDLVRAADVARRRLGELSGGELQRVLLAFALQREPDLLLLDEPGAGVDRAGEELFCELMEKLRRERGFTQLMVSHNLPLVAAHAERVVLLNRRVVAQGAAREVLVGHNLEAAYGVHMGHVGGDPEECPECRRESARLKAGET